MCRPLLLLAFLAIHSALFAQNTLSLADELNYYKQLNGSEKALLEFADSDSALMLKIKQLHRINEYRQQCKRQTVQLDILACRVANKMATEAAQEKFIGHWNTAGEKPYHRWAAAGGKDHVAENAYGEWCSAAYKTSNFLIDSLMQAGFKAFISERKPNDGHKQNILNAGHNFVGLGICLTEHHFRYYEEFIDRYFVFKFDLKPVYKRNELIELPIICDSSIGITQVFASLEKKLKPMNPLKISLKGSYFDGTFHITTFNVPHRQPDGTYLLQLRFKKKGTYYLHIFQRPYVKGRLAGQEIQASGILIQVE